MDESRNSAMLLEGGESRSLREQASQENNANDVAAGDTSPATHRSPSVRARHTAESIAEAEAPQRNPNGQRGSHKNKGKPGRASPFDPFWETEIVPLLERDLAAGITPPGILDTLLNQHPEAFAGRDRQNLLKTLGRSIGKWRKKRGRDRLKRWKSCDRSQGTRRRARRQMTIFPQNHPPGREVAVDFTDCKELRVTIGGQLFPHELFDFRMSHSGWTHVEVFRGETLSALMQGLQNAFRELGGVPQVVRSDNRRNAIHNKRPVEPYGAFLKHYGLELSLINYYRPNENGGVEGENGRIKERIKQALLIRDSRDFESAEDYAAFVGQVVDRNNRRDDVQHKLQEERARLRPLPETAAPDYIEKEVKVSELSLISLYSNRYSVPCQVVGQKVTVRLYAEHLEVYRLDGGRLVVQLDRVHGNDELIINYRHVFPDLVRKWGAFARLPPEYKEQLFPRSSFKTTHEKLREWYPNIKKANGLDADYQYVRILHLASKGDREEAAVDQALQQLLEAGRPFDFDDIKRLVASPLHAPVGLSENSFDPPDRIDESPPRTPLLI